MEMFLRKTLAATVAVAAMAATFGGAQAADEKFITIGTGGQTGVYFVVGQSICKLVNR
ncbi:MAG TPA: C4-dicarboxylate ABC transporter substrate-binding protein, partial [Rhodospirillaceae bacterium]|nr:C4-dicarboxylate ABC transporter substrate-binding protein [Rhodospirillaceae bacterium]